jgi:predicted Zn finger-like uncharacterized protein
MSLTTRCPACQTVFKVVPDQLRIAAGWVRCGECGVVFDGSAQMLASETGVEPAPAGAPDPAAAPAAIALESEAGPDEPPIGIDADVEAEGKGAASLPADLSPDALDSITLRFAELERDLLLNPPTPVLLPAGEPWLDESEPDLPPEPKPEPDADPAASIPDAEGPTESGDARDPTESDAPAAASLPPEPKPELELAPEPDADPAASVPDAEGPTESGDARDPAESDAPAPASLPPEPTPTAEPDVPSFVAQAQRRAVWETGRARNALWVAFALLLVVLVGQWTVRERDWLAARSPQLQPLLQALCQPLGCRIEPYRRLDAVVIDGSSFNRIDPQRFRFSVTLHNEADLPVATPALELSLTDTAGQVLVRRVLLPDELDAPVALAPRGEFDGSHTLTVAGAAQPHTITSYRVQAFYP